MYKVRKAYDWKVSIHKFPYDAQITQISVELVLLPGILRKCLENDYVLRW